MSQKHWSVGCMHWLEQLATATHSSWVVAWLFPGGAQVVPGTTPDPKKDPERKVQRASRWVFPE